MACLEACQARFGPSEGPFQVRLGAARHTQNDNGNENWCDTVWLGTAKSASGKAPKEKKPHSMLHPGHTAMKSK